MKGSFLWKFAYVLCALAGCLAGYGIIHLTSNAEIKPDRNTKDNTLVRDAENSVFFDAEMQEKTEPVPTAVPTITVAPTVRPVRTEKPVVPVLSNQEETVIATPTPESVPPLPAMPTEPTELSQDKSEAVSEQMPSLASQWASSGLPVPTQIPTAEVITYPAKIFGQVPVINRSDAYVSYFEFAYDLIAMLEPEVEQRGLNLNSLLTKFALKALFCGVDIEKLDINAPIPRKLAALCLWLAAQVLGENGCDTSAKSAGEYVTDIGTCSSSERKAVAYLYEQGVLKGYQVPGQKFYPENGLNTESGSTWLSGIKQCWK